MFTVKTRLVLFRFLLYQWATSPKKLSWMTYLSGTSGLTVVASSCESVLTASTYPLKKISVKQLYSQSRELAHTIFWQNVMFHTNTIWKLLYPHLQWWGIYTHTTKCKRPPDLVCLKSSGYIPSTQRTLVLNMSEQTFCNILSETLDF